MKLNSFTVNDNYYEWEYQEETSKRIENWALVNCNYIYRKDIVSLHFTDMDNKICLFFYTLNADRLYKAYLLMYGENEKYWYFDSLVEAKDQVELFMNKLSKLKAFL